MRAQHGARPDPKAGARRGSRPPARRPQDCVAAAGARLRPGERRCQDRRRRSTDVTQGGPKRVSTSHLSLVAPPGARHWPAPACCWRRCRSPTATASAPRRRRRSDLRSPARCRRRRGVRAGRVGADAEGLAARRGGQDRDRAVPAAADAGRGRRGAGLQRPRHARVPDHDQEPARADLLQPGPSPLVRVQPRRSAARVPDRAEARSELRRVLLGRGAHPRPEHQRADGAGSERARGRGARQGRRAEGPRRRQGARLDRGAREALLGRRQDGAPAARQRLRRRDEGRRRALSAGRHDPHALRRERDGHPAVGLLGARRREGEGPRRRDHLESRGGAQAQARTMPARSTSTSTRSRRRRRPNARSRPPSASAR